MLKELAREVSEEETLRQSKWRNVYFSKQGKSYRGIPLFNNQHDAQQRVKFQIAQCTGPNTSPDRKGWSIPTMDGKLPFEDYSWSMQMPVMGG